MYIVLAGVNGDKLHFALSDVAQAASKVTTAGVLGYGASQIGFTASYAGMASDFVSFLSLAR